MCFCLGLHAQAHQLSGLNCQLRTPCGSVITPASQSTQLSRILFRNCLHHAEGRAQDGAEEQRTGCTGDKSPEHQNISRRGNLETILIFSPRGGKKKLSHELQFGSGRTRPKPKRHKSERGQCSDLDSQPSPVPSCCWLECPTRQVHCCHLYTPDQQLRSLIEGARVRTRDTNAQQRNTRGGEP